MSKGLARLPDFWFTDAELEMLESPGPLGGPVGPGLGLGRLCAKGCSRSPPPVRRRATPAPDDSVLLERAVQSSALEVKLPCTGDGRRDRLSCSMDWGVGGATWIGGSLEAPAGRFKPSDKLSADSRDLDSRIGTRMARQALQRPPAL